MFEQKNKKVAAGNSQKEKIRKKEAGKIEKIPAIKKKSEKLLVLDYRLGAGSNWKKIFSDPNIAAKHQSLHEVLKELEKGIIGCRFFTKDSVIEVEQLKQHDQLILLERQLIRKRDSLVTKIHETTRRES